MNTQQYIIYTLGDQSLLALAFITEIANEENVNITILPVDVIRIKSEAPNISISDRINAIVPIIGNYRETLKELLKNKGIPNYHQIIIQEILDSTSLK